MAYPAVHPLVLNLLQDTDASKPTAATSLGLNKGHRQHKYVDTGGGVIYRSAPRLIPRVMVTPTV